MVGGQATGLGVTELGLEGGPDGLLIESLEPGLLQGLLGRDGSGELGPGGSNWLCCTVVGVISELVDVANGGGVITLWLGELEPGLLQVCSKGLVGGDVGDLFAITCICSCC